MKNPSRPTEERRPVYGPIRSWRFGRSLGIDLLLESSICSFRCIYCQLGRIHRHTAHQSIWVPTERVIEELRAVDWLQVDVATFSGSGEPTLALNLGEAIRAVKEIGGKPVIVLTNAAHFLDADTRGRVLAADRVVCKLDAASEPVFKAFNRPAEGITLNSVIEGIRRLRNEYSGTLCLQCMFMPSNVKEAEGIASIAAALRPDEVQINTPHRPKPAGWLFAARGVRAEDAPIPGKHLPTLSEEETVEVESMFRSRLPGVPLVVSHSH